MNEIMLQETAVLKELEPSKGAQILAVFVPMGKMLESFENQYNDIISMEVGPEACAKAKRLRLDIAKIRINTDKEHKKLKAESLLYGRAIDGVKNILNLAISKKEQNLKDIELFYERQEAERLRKLQAERAAELLKYDFNGAELELGMMVDSVWTNFLNGTKLNYEAVKEAERKAEAERIKKEADEKIFHGRQNELKEFGQFVNWQALNPGIAEDEYLTILQEATEKQEQHDREQEEIRKQNIKLQEEKEAIEKKVVIERKKAADKVEAERKKNAAILQKEREAREAIEQKAADKKATADKKLQEEKEAEKKAAAAPDKEKLFSLCEYMAKVTTGLSTQEAKNIVDAARVKIFDATRNL